MSSHFDYLGLFLLRSMIHLGLMEVIVLWNIKHKYVTHNQIFRMLAYNPVEIIIILIP